MAHPEYAGRGAKAVSSLVGSCQCVRVHVPGFLDREQDPASTAVVTLVGLRAGLVLPVQDNVLALAPLAFVFGHDHLGCCLGELQNYSLSVNILHYPIFRCASILERCVIN